MPAAIQTPDNCFQKFLSAMLVAPLISLWVMLFLSLYKVVATVRSGKEQILRLSTLPVVPTQACLGRRHHRVFIDMVVLTSI